MDAELLTVGSELTSGATLNTNAAYLARRLAECGIPCRRQVTVGDERSTLTDALREALSRADLLILTGGLGPTFDDVTMETIAKVTGRSLVASAAVAATIRRFYTRSHRTLQRAALRQAYLPEGGVALPNPIGTAPGLWLALKQQLVIALPGVPSEMRAIMERHVLPRLKRRGSALAIESETLRTAGVVELSIEAILRHLKIPAGVEIGLYPHLRMVDIRLTATASSRQAARRALSRIDTALRRRLAPSAAIYGTDEETLEEVIGRMLVAQHLTLAVAESCTGGLVSDRLTNVPGSSRYLRGSVVAYHNDVKRRCAGVSASTLAQFGAVSAQTAGEMAKGARLMLGADVGLSITGIAGPTGGTKQKPVGLVCLGLSDGRRTRTQRCQFFGDRLAIKAQAAQVALDWLRRYLTGARHRVVRRRNMVSGTGT